jgi:hypothetical protein
LCSCCIILIFQGACHVSAVATCRYL